jgi:outer membrane biosynthesis protein TonB
MKILAILIILLAIDLPDLNKIATINRLKEEAAAAYKQARYNVAINRYKNLIDTLGEKDEKLLLNLAHAYYKSEDTTNAYKQYSELTSATDNYVRSLAHQQMGTMRVKAKDLESALLHYKSALKAEPKNDEARANYETVKKMLEQQKKQQQQQNQDNKDQSQDKKESEQDKKEQEKKEQEKKEQEKKEQEKKEQEKKQKESQGSDKKTDNSDKKQAERDDESKNKGKEKEQNQSQLRSERLQQMNMTEAQAKMVLDAMKSTEVQYLQQSQKRAGKKADKTKPDW